LVEHHLSPRALREIVGERLEDILVHRRVFHRGVGEDQRARVLEFLHVPRRVGDEVLVLVAIKHVELAAVLAIVGLRAGEHAGSAQRDPEQ